MSREREPPRSRRTLVRRTLPHRIAALVAAVVALQVAAAREARSQTGFDHSLDRALESFYAAAYDGESRYVAAAIDRVLELDPSLGVLVERLRRGRTYQPVEPGVYESTHLVDGVEHHFAWVVPDSYDPAVPIPAQVMLHGGISREDRRAGGQGPIENLTRARHVTILPSGWRDSKWWHTSQLANLRSILRELRGRLNLDENRIGLAGISDGATGAYYVAMLDPGPWAYFMAFIGNPRVLSSVDVEGDLFPANMRNRSILSINTDGDRLYPFSRVAPTLRSLVEAGVDIDIVEQEGYGHDTQWWGLQIRRIESFSNAHARNAAPLQLSWTTSEPGRFGRFLGLEIIELGAARGEVDHPEPPIITGLFPTERPWGRVRLAWQGNRLVAWTRGVRQFHVWLEAEQVDYNLPITIEVNGETYAEEQPTPSRRTMLERFAAELDRTRLEVAAVEITLR